MNRPLSTSELVITLAETGMTAAEIIKASGLPAQRVHRWIDKAHVAGRNVQSSRARRGITVLSGDALTRTRIEVAASKRGLTEAQLIDLIMGFVAADDLFDAILDGAP